MAEATTSLIAIRDRRERVIAALTDHFTNDLLDVDEFERRIDRAHRAGTLNELDAIVTDLAPPPTGQALEPVVETRAMVVRDDPNRPAEKRMWMVMSGIERKGVWMVPRKMRVRCFWGGGVFDFREADFGPGVTELHISAVMGGVQLIIPPWLAVDVDATAIMGGFDERHRASGRPDPDRPILRITGFVMMGGVAIETRLPNESARDARRREKREQRERRALEPGNDRALPGGKE